MAQTELFVIVNYKAARARRAWSVVQPTLVGAGLQFDAHEARHTGDAQTRTRVALILAFAWMAFAFLIVMTWHVPFLDAMVPKWMIKAIYPIDKTDLDMLRFTHFLALALVVARFFPRKSEILTSKWLRPMVLCGQHSLPIFCFGVFLSFGAHWILVQHAQGGARALWMQLLVSVGGILIMIGLAWLLDRAQKVPSLFVDVSTVDLPEAATKPGTA